MVEPISRTQGNSAESEVHYSQLVQDIRGITSNSFNRKTTVEGDARKGDRLGGSAGPLRNRRKDSVGAVGTLSATKLLKRDILMNDEWGYTVPFDVVVKRR